MAANQKRDTAAIIADDLCLIDFADFGLFYQVPRNSGALYQVSSVLDTYIYNGLTATGDFGMTAAAGLYQSVVGMCLLLAANLVVRKLEPDSALF